MKLRRKMYKTNIVKQPRIMLESKRPQFEERERSFCFATQKCKAKTNL